MGEMRTLYLYRWPRSPFIFIIPAYRARALPLPLARRAHRTFPPASLPLLGAFNNITLRTLRAHANLSGAPRRGRSWRPRVYLSAYAIYLSMLLAARATPNINGASRAPSGNAFSGITLAYVQAPLRRTTARSRPAP